MRMPMETKGSAAQGQGKKKATQGRPLFKQVWVWGYLTAQKI
jgi:hypothetical protein